MSDVELTATRIRMTVKAARGVTTKASLRLERQDYRNMSLSSLAPKELLSTFEGLENESPELQAAIARASELVARMNKAEARRRELEAERKRINEDQERVRKNLESVGQGSTWGAAISTR